MILKEKKPTTDNEAIESLSFYTGIFHNITVCQFKLSRQNGQSIEDSLQNTHDKVLDITNEALEQWPLQMNKLA